MSNATLDVLYVIGWCLSFSVLVGGAFGALIAFLESRNEVDE